jgi:hypothetical protein
MLSIIVVGLILGCILAMALWSIAVITESIYHGTTKRTRNHR